MSAFLPTRDNGRSDREVVYELIQEAAPETTYTYDELASVLQDGVDEPITRRRAYRAAQSANRMLLRENRRALRTIPGVGVRVMRADEHLPVAIERKERAEHQYKRGLELLRNTRMDELDPTQRKLHEGQLLILSGIYQVVRETSRRVARQDDAIKDIRHRLEQLEGTLIDV